MIFDGKHGDPWASGEPRSNSLVFIGKNLDKKGIEEAFVACLDSPENAEKMHAIEAETMLQQMAKMALGAAQRDDAAALKELVSAGVDMNRGNGMGQTPLHIACMWGNYVSVDILIAAGADLNAKNRLGGSTPLHMITDMDKGTMRGRVECAKKMATAGADLSAKDKKGTMPYEYAEEAGDVELRDILTPQ